MRRILPVLVYLFLPAVFILAVSFFVPLPVPHDLDFSVLYFTDKALLDGIPIYDYPAQLQMLQEEAGPNITFHPFSYPPWYTLATIFLALMPIEVAARMWFLINLVMIASAIWILTPCWKTTRRLFIILGAFLFVPVLGLVVVGQYSTPVLLGTALFLWAVRTESPAGAAVALGLMTFKPHIGLFLVLVAFGWLVYHRREAFPRRALVLTLGLAMILSVASCIADSAWPLNYIESLNRYREIPGVQSCGLCASLSVGIVKLWSGEPDASQAALVSLGLALGLLISFFWKFGSRSKDAVLLTSFFAIFTLIVDPYLLNYDYILLLLPLVALGNQVRSTGEGVLLTIAYLLPWGVIVLGRDGNFLLIASTLLVLILLYWNRVAETLLLNSCREAR